MSDGSRRRGPRRRAAGRRRFPRSLLLSLFSSLSTHRLGSPMRCEPVSALLAASAVESKDSDEHVDPTPLSLSTTLPSQMPSPCLLRRAALLSGKMARRHDLLLNLFDWSGRVVDWCLGVPSAWDTASPLGPLRCGGGSQGSSVAPPEALRLAGAALCNGLTDGSMRTFRISSCFSGLDTAEVCGCAIGNALAARGFGVTIKTGLGFELDPVARRVFRMAAGDARCAGDLLALWPADVKDRLQVGFESFEKLRNFLEQSADRLSFTARCPDTGVTWDIDLGDLHCGGNPCKDWSLIGKRRGLLGPTASVLVTWCILIKSTPGPAGKCAPFSFGAAPGASGARLPGRVSGVGSATIWVASGATAKICPLQSSPQAWPCQPRCNEIPRW